MHPNVTSKNAYRVKIIVLLSTDLIFQIVCLFFKIYSIPNIRYGAYKSFQLGVTIFSIVIILSAIILNGLSKMGRRNSSIWGICYSGSLLGNLVALLVPAVAIFSHGYWYRMCEDMIECPWRLDFEAVKISLFCVAVIGWTMTVQLTILYYTISSKTETSNPSQNIKVHILQGSEQTAINPGQ